MSRVLSPSYTTAQAAIVRTVSLLNTCVNMNYGSTSDIQRHLMAVRAEQDISRNQVQHCVYGQNIFGTLQAVYVLQWYLGQVAVNVVLE